MPSWQHFCGAAAISHLTLFLREFSVLITHRVGRDMYPNIETSLRVSIEAIEKVLKIEKSPTSLSDQLNHAVLNLTAAYYRALLQANETFEGHITFNEIADHQLKEVFNELLSLYITPDGELVRRDDAHKIP